MAVVVVVVVVVVPRGRGRAVRGGAQGARYAVHSLGTGGGRGGGGGDIQLQTGAAHEGSRVWEAGLRGIAGIGLRRKGGSCWLQASDCLTGGQCQWALVLLTDPGPFAIHNKISKCSQRSFVHQRPSVAQHRRSAGWSRAVCRRLRGICGRLWGI